MHKKQTKIRPFREATRRREIFRYFLQEKQQTCTPVVMLTTVYSQCYDNKTESCLQNKFGIGRADLALLWRTRRPESFRGLRSVRNRRNVLFVVFERGNSISLCLRFYGYGVEGVAKYDRFS